MKSSDSNEFYYILFTDSGTKLHGNRIRKGKCLFLFLSVVPVVVIYK